MADRLQREIDEILSRLEGFPPKQSLRVRLRRRLANGLRGLSHRFASLQLPRVSIGQLMLAAIVLIIIAYVFRSGTFGGYLIGAGIGLFVLAFVLSLRRTYRPPEKRWRGQPMELHGSSVGTRLRSWWERWRSRR